MNRFCYFIMISVLGTLGCNKSKNNEEAFGNNKFKIAIGSCYDLNLNDNSIWKEIRNTDPDLWLWLGDIVYSDTHDISVIERNYNTLKNDVEYQKLIDSMPIIGIWDDHDYGQNDGGKFYSKKKESKEQLLNFLDVSESDSVYNHEGIYSSYVYGEGNKKTKIILLDTRYFRDTVETDSESEERYKVNEIGDILGEDQWSWLESELQKNEAAIHIIASGYQIIAWEPKYEKWSNFPTARQRLFDLLVKTQPNRTFLLSGDRHISEVAKLDIKGLDYPLYEFTSSGMTHTWDEVWIEENRHRVSGPIIQKNFGLIVIDWEKQEPQITFEIRGHNDSLFTAFIPKL